MLRWAASVNALLAASFRATLQAALYHLPCTILGGHQTPESHLQAAPPLEFDHHHFVVMVLHEVCELREVVNVIFHRVPALMPACTLQTHDGGELFIPGAEMVNEVQLEAHPVWICWTSDPFSPDDLICKMGGTSKFEEQEGPVNVSLIIREMVNTD